jgi:succinoglycan biosynthesis protein ExoO
MADVSIILPVYNNAAVIERAIRSAQNQTLRDIEIVVVDDASTDATPAIVDRLAAEDSRIKVTHLSQNVGCAAARNVALANATGAWVATLDGDDWFEPNRLEALLKTARESDADVVLDNLHIYDHARDEIFETTRHGLKGRPMVVSAETYFLKDNPIRRHVLGILKPLVRRTFLQAHAIAYNPSHRLGQDFIFLAEIILNGGKAVIVPEAYYVYVRRISPTTRKVSPHSRSGFDYGMIVRGCDELLQKYGAIMTPAARQALKRRRYLFQTRLIFQRMLTEFDKKNLSRVAVIFLKQPMIFVFLVSAAMRRLRTKLICGQRRLDKLLMMY